MNLSTLISITPKKDANENNVKIMATTVKAVQLTFGLFCCSHFAHSATAKGWQSKPIPRSETAKLRSNVFKGFCNKDVFLNAWIVMAFNTTR